VNRKTYLQMIAIFLGALIVSALLVAAWLIMLIPAMLLLGIYQPTNPLEQIMPFIIKRGFRAANSSRKKGEKAA
jgi:hypothetical protein